MRREYNINGIKGRWDHDTIQGMMSLYSCKVDNQGRISLPSIWRRNQGVEPNSELVVTIEEDRLILQTREQRLHEARRLVSQYATKGLSQVDDLLHERREEARRERDT